MERAFVGFLLLAVGVAITAGTYAAAGPGGTYVVSWGLILFGFLQFVQGLQGFFKAKKYAQHPELRHREEFETKLMSIGSAIAGAGGRPEEAEVEAIAELAHRRFGRRWDKKVIRSTIAGSPTWPIIERELVALRHIDANARKDFIESIARVALAKGYLREEQLKFVASLAVSIGVEGQALRDCIRRAAVTRPVP